MDQVYFAHSWRELEGRILHPIASTPAIDEANKRHPSSQPKLSSIKKIKKKVREGLSDLEAPLSGCYDNIDQNRDKQKNELSHMFEKRKQKNKTWECPTKTKEVLLFLHNSWS